MSAHRHDARPPPLSTHSFHRPRPRPPGAWREPADYQSLQVLVFHLRTVAYLNGKCADPLGADFSRHHRVDLLDCPADPQAALSLAAVDLAQARVATAVAAAQSARMDRQMVN